jgi:hypothetical protein
MILFAIVVGVALMIIAIMRDDTGSAMSNKALLGIGFGIIAFFVFVGGVLPLAPIGP